MGGPEIAGTEIAGAAKFLRGFLEHCVRGTNHATGKQGSPLDFVAFHAKGCAANSLTGTSRRASRPSFRTSIVDSRSSPAYPGAEDKPIIIGESDPDGCAACPATVYPQNGYRNGTLYASYTAAALHGVLDLADKHAVNLEGA